MSLKRDKSALTLGFLGLGLAALGYWLLKQRSPSLGAVLPYAETLVRQMATHKPGCTTCKQDEIQMTQAPTGVWQA